MVYRKSRWRKLTKGEHRYIGRNGKVKIAKPKQYKRWKTNKEYDRKLGVWKFKGGEGPNVKIVIALYKYETHDSTGKTLELDIVGSIIIKGSEFSEVKDPRALMASYVRRNLLQSQYYGLAVAAANGLESADEQDPDKFGFEITRTNEELQDFRFDRFFINKKDYTNSVNSGVSNIKRRDDEDEDKRNKTGRGPQKELPKS